MNPTSQMRRYAAEVNAASCVEVIIAAEAEKVSGCWNTKSLHYAAWNGSAETLKVLLKHANTLSLHA